MSIFEEIFRNIFGSNARSPPNRQESMDRLNAKASSFIQLFEHHRHQMQGSVQSCQSMSFKTRLHQKTLKLCLFLSASLLLLTIVVVAALALDQYQFAVKAMLTSALALPFMAFCIIEINDKPTYRRIMNVSIEEFRWRVLQLNAKLNEVKGLCVELDRCVTGSDRVRMMRLEQSVLEVLQVTTDLTQKVGWTSSADDLAWVCEEHSRALYQLDKMKIHLSFFTGTRAV